MSEPLAFAIVGHLVGDYLMQNDWMAQNKKLRSFPCIVHCFIWTVAVCGFAGWESLWVVAFLFATHFIQDRTQIIRWWMRWNRQEGFAQPPLAPWSMIVVDNVWHIVALASVAKWMV